MLMGYVWIEFFVFWFKVFIWDFNWKESMLVDVKFILLFCLFSIGM